MTAASKLIRTGLAAFALSWHFSAHASRICAGAMGDAAFNFPSTFVAQKLAVSDVDPAGHSPELEQLKAEVEAVAGELNKKGLNRADVAFYPMAGYDASTPAQLFPNARLIVATSWARFVKDPDAIVSPKYGRQNVAAEYDAQYILWDEDQKSDSNASLEIARLSLVTPGFRLRRAVAFREGPTKIHGLIEYDSGPDTPIKRYVHVHQNAGGDGSYAARSWWMRELRSIGVGAMVVKADYGVFRKRTAFAAAVDELLGENAAVVVEDAEDTNSPQYTGFIAPDRLAFRRFTGLPYGYGTAVISRYRTALP